MIPPQFWPAFSLALFFVRLLPEGQAHDAIHSLRIYLHDRSIEHGVAKPPYKGKPEEEEQADPPHR
jgi:hypothetical protein